MYLCTVGIRSVVERTDMFWYRSNPENKTQLSWDEYRARQYGFLTGYIKTVLKDKLKKFNLHKISSFFMLTFIGLII